MEVIQLLVSGLLFGGVLAMLASGLSLIFGVMRLVNFAQGDFVMVGMYVVLVLFSVTRINPILLAVVAAGGVGLLGYLLHRMVIGKVAIKESAETRHDAQLIVTLGISLILQSIAVMIFGASAQSTVSPAEISNILIAGVSISVPRAIAFLVAAIATSMLFALLKFTAFGRSLRAATDDPIAAGYVGVNVTRVYRATFALGSLLAGLGGGLLATFYTVNPYVSWDFIILMFVAIVLGGMGSILGAAISGVTIGIVWALTLLVLPLQLQYVGVFAVFLIVIFVRPQGLFGLKERVS